MDAERWEQIEALFFDALEREAEERAAFLDEACANNAALRGKVEAMLAAHEQSEGLLLEQRLLAQLQHPNIVGRLSAGRVALRTLSRVPSLSTRGADAGRDRAGHL